MDFSIIVAFFGIALSALTLWIAYASYRKNIRAVELMEKAEKDRLEEYSHTNLSIESRVITWDFTKDIRHKKLAIFLRKTGKSPARNISIKLDPSPCPVGIDKKLPTEIDVGDNYFEIWRCEYNNECGIRIYYDISWDENSGERKNIRGELPLNEVIS